MGLISGMLGHASTVDVKTIEAEIVPLLGTEEPVELAFKLVRDLIVFTNKRLILVDKQGITGKKVEYHSIPYKSISHFSVETAGHFDLDSELNIYISGSPTPSVHKEFKNDKSIFEIHKALVHYTLG